MQAEIIEAVMEGKDTLALLPTGGGKSVCFQVPAMLKEGVCLVITPLIALMKDQVQNLRKKEIPAHAIYSGMTITEVETVLENARRGFYKFLYVSPERLLSKRFQDYCDGLPVSLIAVDEAHCISQWGYDFRPAYLLLAEIRNFFPKAPVLALTASATPRVQDDIVEKLRMRNAQRFTKSFARANLSYSVRFEDGRMAQLQQILHKVPGSAIIYCRNRKRTQDIAALLQAQDITAQFYHAGLPASQRHQRQDDWLKGDTRVIVCTNAFGMGIDKPDVRLVIHYDIPDSLEAYYQEAGRAGRDEQKAYAVLLCHESDLDDLQSRVALQFPQEAEIREVYQCIVNYLHVAIGSSEGKYYDFDINDFARTFKLNITVVYSAIRILEQEGVLQLSESILLPSRVGFVTNKQTLYAFEEAHPQVSPLIKALLRTYEGIFDVPVRIYERQLDRILLQEEDEIMAHLHWLDHSGILQYEPRRDKPQLCFLQERVGVQQLRINMQRVMERRKAYEERLAAMTAYARNHTECRTRILVTYFGETLQEDCGVCDVCLQKKITPLNNDRFTACTDKICAALKSMPTDVSGLLAQLPGVEESVFFEVLQFLISEGRVQRDKDGMLHV
ncbi:RecQ family ATP-dependent DNA helicase [Chitinophaga costaii]|nr:RecQ family ATP-dependent DNA helicase [Chitinophaga costaii]